MFMCESRSPQSPEDISNPLELELQAAWCGCWQLNSRDLQEQEVLSIAESHLSSIPILIFVFSFFET